MTAHSFAQAASETVRTALEQAGSIEALASRYLELTAKVEQLTRKLADAKLAAQRWETARVNLTKVYQLYTRDERHDKLRRQGEGAGEGVIADEAVDRVRSEGGR